jgi:thiol-disulfide isomerase/thioredoxin
MNKLFDKKLISNILFVFVIILLLYPPAREWGMRKIAFAPSIVDVDETESIQTYNWELNGVTTKSINFNKFEGKVIFVNFWATWCPPCRAEMPMIQKLYNDYKGKVTFVFVTNENLATVKTFFDKNEYNLPVYNSFSEPPQKFTETNSIPASYLIDKKGSILISKVGAADWNSKKVRNLLDKLLKQ